MYCLIFLICAEYLFSLSCAHPDYFASWNKCLELLKSLRPPCAPMVSCSTAAGKIVENASSLSPATVSFSFEVTCFQLQQRIWQSQLTVGNRGCVCQPVVIQTTVHLVFCKAWSCSGIYYLSWSKIECIFQDPYNP